MTSLTEILNGRAAQGENGHSPAILAETNGSAPAIDAPTVLKSRHELAETARLAILEAATGGVTLDELHDMVAIAKPLLNDKDQYLIPGFELDPPPVYEQLPPGMIDLPAAAAKYELRLRTVRAWVTRGHLEIVGRLKSRAPGGGNIVVREDDLVAFLNTPRPRGRPKTPN